MFAFLTKLEIQNGTLKFEFKYFEGYGNILDTVISNLPCVHVISDDN